MFFFVSIFLFPPFETVNQLTDWNETLYWHYDTDAHTGNSRNCSRFTASNKNNFAKPQTSEVGGNQPNSAFCSERNQTTAIVEWHSYVRASQIYFQITTNKLQLFLIYYFYRRSTCFRRFLRPSSGAQNSTYSFRYCQPILLLAASCVDEMVRGIISSTLAANSNMGWQYLKLYVQFCALDDGRRNRLKHVELL